MVRRVWLLGWFRLVPTRQRLLRTVLVMVGVTALYLPVISFMLLTTAGQRLQLWRAPPSTSRQNASAYANGTAQVVKTIVLWNPYFAQADYHFGLGRRPFLRFGCSVNACRTTLDKSEVSGAEAVVFHTPDIDVLPSERPSRQKYVFVQREPHYPKSREVLGTYGDMFNLTMTYRHDSDIPIPYGVVVDRAELARRPVSYPPEVKTKDVVWLVSHCTSLGRRELYMDELKKYISVDVYGGCGNMSCDKTFPGVCLKELQKQYRYYVAFENTYCLDYVTEKLYRSLSYDMIPIVYGKVNYTAVSPPHSVIDVMEFPNPKTLASYLSYLSGNPEQYLRYFEWKKTMRVVYSHTAIFSLGFCRLCEILHDADYKYKEYRNISSWWLEDTCEIAYMTKLRKKQFW